MSRETVLGDWGATGKPTTVEVNGCSVGTFAPDGGPRGPARSGTEMA